MLVVTDVTALRKVGQHATRLLLATGDLVTGWLLVRQAEVALGALAGERDRHSHEGKPAAARLLTAQVLPQPSAERVVVENTDHALMEVDEAAFRGRPLLPPALGAGPRPSQARVSPRTAPAGPGSRADRTPRRPSPSGGTDGRRPFQGDDDGHGHL